MLGFSVLRHHTVWGRIAHSTSSWPKVMTVLQDLPPFVCSDLKFHTQVSRTYYSNNLLWISTDIQIVTDKVTSLYSQWHISWANCFLKSLKWCLYIGISAISVTEHVFESCQEYVWVLIKQNCLTYLAWIICTGSVVDEVSLFKFSWVSTSRVWNFILDFVDIVLLLSLLFEGEIIDCDFIVLPHDSFLHFWYWFQNNKC